MQQDQVSPAKILQSGENESSILEVAKSEKDPLASTGKTKDLGMNVESPTNNA